MTAYKSILAAVMSLMVFVSIQAAAQEQKPYVGSEAFEQMKQLVGSWEGTMDMGKGPEKVTANYKLTSGGSAVVETAFKGEPHEMMTVFHDDAQKKLKMTHYCMLGNQPKMTLKSMEKNKFVFDLAHDSDIDVAQEKHMHAATISLDGTDKMTQYWTKFEGGQKKEIVEVVYNRVK